MKLHPLPPALDSDPAVESANRLRWALDMAEYDSSKTAEEWLDWLRERLTV